VSADATIESDLGRLEGEWEALAERSGASPFHHPGWVRAWFSAFGAGSLHVLALRHGGALEAVIPLQEFRGRLSSPTNWHTPVFGPVSEGPQSTRELMEGLFALDARSIDLSLLDVDDGTMGVTVDAARRAHRLVSTRLLTRSPWVALEGSWDDYERGMSKNRRKGMRRRERRLEEQGAVSLEMVMGGPRLDELLDEALRIEASGWKGRRRTAMESRPETRRFYLEIARWAAERGWLKLAFLRLDGVGIAFDLSLERDRARYSLKAGYHAAFARYGPGVLLIHRLLRDAHEAGVERFELLGEEDPFKLDWTNRISKRAWLRACSTSTAGRAEATVIRARERVRPLARTVRDWVE
jgi:CelD/BcsL family acetyltransferase involved in cellulose biosynthesis